MTEDFLAVGALDLGVGGAVAVFGKAEDGVVVLSLDKTSGRRMGRRGDIEYSDYEGGKGIHTFQSLASLPNINGSSGSLIVSPSSSSTFLTFSLAWMRSSSEKVLLCRFYPPGLALPTSQNPLPQGQMWK